MRSLIPVLIFLTIGVAGYFGWKEYRIRYEAEQERIREHNRFLALEKARVDRELDERYAAQQAELERVRQAKLAKIRERQARRLEEQARLQREQEEFDARLRADLAEVARAEAADKADAARKAQDALIEQKRKQEAELEEKLNRPIPPMPKRPPRPTVVVYEEEVFKNENGVIYVPRQMAEKGDVREDKLIAQRARWHFMLAEARRQKLEQKRYERRVKLIEELKAFKAQYGR